MSNGASSAPTTTSGWTLDATSHLMQDYALTADIEVSVDSSAPIAVFVNAQGATELVIVASDTSLVHVFPDSSSSSGWNVQAVAEGFAATAVVAATDIDGSVHAFAIGTSNDLYHIEQNADGTWAPPANLGCAVESINIAWQYSGQAKGPLLLFGLTTDGKVLIAAQDSATLFDSSASTPVGGWRYVAIGPPLPAGTQYALTSQFLASSSSGQSPATSLNIYTAIAETNQNGITSCQVILGQLGLPLSAESEVGYQNCTTTLMDTPVQNFMQPLAHWGGAGAEAACLAQRIVTDQHQTLWGMTIYNSMSGTQNQISFVPLTYNMWREDSLAPYGIAVTQVCAASQTVNFPQYNQSFIQMQVFFLDTNNSLWVARPTGFDSNGSPTWSPPMPLGDKLSSIFLAPDADFESPLYAADESGALCALWQDEATANWITQKIQQPTEQWVEISNYCTTLMLFDEDGLPLSNASVSINASTSTTIWVNGTPHQIDAKNAATVNTDGSGSVAVVSLAMGLGAPTLSCNATGLAQPKSVNPAQDIHDYLSGASASLNNLPQFNAGTLQQATDANNNLIAPKLTTAGATAAVTGIQQALQIPINSSAGNGGTTARAAVASSPGWRMDFAPDPRNPRLRPLGADELNTLRQKISTGNLRVRSTSLRLGLVGSVSHDIDRAAGDIWHGIKKLAIGVESFSVDVEQCVINLTLSIEDQILNDVQIAINGIEDVVNVVHTIFAAIGAAVEEAIEWLRLMFAWDDINNTRRVLEYLLNQTPDYVQNLIQNHVEPTVSGFFQKLETKITAHCDDIKQSMGADTQLSALGQSSSPPPTARLGLGTSASSTDPGIFTKSPLARWVLDRSRPYLAVIEGLEIPADDSFSSAFNAFYADLGTAYADFKTALQDLENFFISALKHPADFKALKLGDLIDALKEIVGAALAFADGIVSSLLTLLSNAMDTFRTYLTQSVTIPLISSLYQKECGEPMTVSGLSALALALPLTFGYKVLNGASNPPFTSVQANQIVSATNTSGAGGPTARASLAGDEETWRHVFGYLGAGVQTISSFISVALDVANIIESEEATNPLPKWLPPFAIIPEVLSQFLSVPSDSGLPQDPFQEDTEAHCWKVGMWACHWAQPLIDFTLLTLPNEQKTPGPDVTLEDLDGTWNTLLRYKDPGGKIVSSGIGLVTMGVTIAACVLGKIDNSMNGFAVSGNVVGSIPGIGQFLRLESLNDAILESIDVADVGRGAQLINDFFMGTVSGMLYIGSAAES